MALRKTITMLVTIFIAIVVYVAIARFLLIERGYYAVGGEMFVPIVIVVFGFVRLFGGKE